MLRNIKTYLATLVVLVGATSCLEKYPDSAIDDRKAMKTFSDAEQVVTGAYSRLKGSALYSGYLTLLPDIQCDLVHAVQGNTNVMGSFWRWDLRPTDIETEAVYASLYGVIASCNFFLDQVDAVRENVYDDAEFDKLDTYTGEIYAMRALAYSELIKCFCKAYPKTDEEAKGELGVVLKTSYFKSSPIRRASLYDSYKLVIDDLTKAEELLDEEDDQYSNEYLSAAAVQALRARVALYMQKWEDAITYSSKILDRADTPFQLADSKRVQSTASDIFYTDKTYKIDLYSYMWSHDLSYEIIWRVGLTPTSYDNRIGSVFTNFGNDFTNFYPDYIASETVLNLYSANDRRSYSYFRQATTGQGMDLPIVIKYFGNRTFFSNNLFEISMPKPFRLSELYLIRAEAYCQKSNPQFSLANKDLNEMRSKRFSSGYTMNLDSKNWLDQISDERARELYLEGFRLQDLKRWGRGFERKMQTGAQTEGATLKIEPNDPRFVWPIPKHELEAPGSEILPNESNK